MTTLYVWIETYASPHAVLNIKHGVLVWPSWIARLLSIKHWTVKFEVQHGEPRAGLSVQSYEKAIKGPEIYAWVLCFPYRFRLLFDILTVMAKAAEFDSWVFKVGCKDLQLIFGIHIPRAKHWDQRGEGSMLDMFSRFDGLMRLFIRYA